MEAQTAAGTPGVAADASATSKAEPQGWLTRKLGGCYHTRDTIEEHPLWGTLFVDATTVLALAANEGYQYVRGKVVGPDQFLVQMRSEQKQQFEQLKDNLGKLSGSVGLENRDALTSVKGAVKSLESANTSLMDQLVLAKRENDNLSKLAQQKTGVSGGYDFILSSNGGIRIDPNTALGIGYMTGNSVGVNLTSRGDTQSAELRSGQSVSYTNAVGKTCKVSVLGLDYEGKSASFVVGCSST